MPSRKVALIAAIAGAALAAPATASAQFEPGVSYDPGSPSGKEYAIPFVEGRSDGAGTTDQQSGGKIAFGIGITPPGEKSGGKQGAGNGPGDSSGTPAARDGESSAELQARINAAEDPGGTAARTFVLALAVLLPAALLALLLMQRAQVSRTGRTA